ncbi:MAG: NYN domain-containing protein [Gemmatimonadota bacterium]|nr:NYN domain-containing protein [Gemmatimonadota bacterium]
MNEFYTRAPHRRSPAEESSSNAALLIDFDNVTMGIRSNLGLELRKLLESDIIKGKVAVQRAYADWRRYPQYIVSLSEASIDLIFAPAYGSSKKNATDIRLAIDALELVFTRPEIGTYILLSGDSDFSSLVLKLKEYGKYIIGVGMQESSSDLLIQNCDEYYSYNSISGLRSAADGPTEKHDPWELASRAILRMVDRKDVMRSDRFKQVMLELDGAFDEKEIGFSKFNRFLTEAASRGILVLEKAPNGQYEVEPGPKARATADGSGTVASAASAPATTAPSARPAAPPASGRATSAGTGGERRDRRRSRGGGRSSERSRRRETDAAPADEAPPEVDEDRLRGAYRLLQDVAAELARPGEPVRDSEVKRRMLEKDGQFDEAALGFRKFSRFLRQAHDEEVIDLERGPEGNYLVSPAGNGAAPPVSDASPSVSDAPAPGTQARPTKSEEPARSARGRSRGRGRGRGRERDEKRDESRDESQSGAGDTPDAARDETPAATPAAAKPADEAVREEATPAATEPSAEPAPAPRADEAGSAAGGRSAPSLGRFRRGSRGRASRPAAPAGPVPGPVDDGASRPEPAEAEEEGPSAGSEEAGDRSPARRSVRGRNRRRGEGEAHVPSGEAAEFRTEVEAMARNYAGVGRRTAEALFSEFGSEVYEVIDSAPERIRSVLPEHRAKAVIEGRENERRGEAGDEA